MGEQPLFTTYERVRRETAEVAEVTEENIGQLAALVGGQVDYSEGAPVLIEPGRSHPWRIKVGYFVSLRGDQFLNRNGFNQDGDWCPTATSPTPPPDDREAGA